MTAIAAALIPTFLLVLIGAAMRRTPLFPEAFWTPLDRLVYFICFPALLLRSLAHAPLGGDLLPMAAALLAGIAILTALLLALRQRITADGPAFTSVFQGAVRFSTFVGLGAVAALYGQPGVAAFAVAIATCVPTLNVLCVLVLARRGGTGGALSWRQQAMLLARNPLILACLAGVAINLSGLVIPLPLDRVLETLDKASLPLGLMAVGAGLELRSPGLARRTVVVSTVARLLFLPALLAGLCWAFSIDGVARNVAILWGALPTASSAYILARQMGGDAPLMAGIITLQTLLAFVTMPVVLTLLG
jgi:predicted permease